MTSNSNQISQKETKTYTYEDKSQGGKNKRFIYLLLMLLGMGGIYLVIDQFNNPDNWTATATIKTESPSVRALAVETITLKPTTSYQVSRSYTGEIAAIRTSDLGFTRGGEIENILVQEGDRIGKGQVIAKLDTRDLEAQKQQLLAEKAGGNAQLAELKTGARQEDIDEAKANVRDIKQQLELQKKQVERREFLYGEGAISREQLEEFASGKEILKARLEKANSALTELENGTRWEKIAAQQALVDRISAQVAQIDVQIDQSTIKAPFNGIIADRLLDEGTVVNTGQSVVRLIENAPPEARIGIPSKTIEQLRIGGSYDLQLGNQGYQGKLTSILPEIDLATRTQTVVFQLDRSAITQINPNQTVKLDLVENIETYGFWLPTTALTQGLRGLWSCYVVTQTSTGEYQVEQKTVEIINQQSDRVFVRGTLQEGDVVVRDGVHRLVPQQIVKVLDAQ